MRLSRLVRLGLQGRKRDTRLLITVLTLCFLFITLSNIVLSSIRYSKEEQQIARHGRFQAIAFEVDEEARAAYHSVAPQSADSLILGQSQRHGLLGTIDRAYMDLGALTLKSGRLPQAANEIVLTQTALEALADKKQVGDSIQVVLDLGYVGDKAIPITMKQFGLSDELYQLSQQSITQQDHAAFELAYTMRRDESVYFFNIEMPQLKDLSPQEYEQEFNTWFYANPDTFGLSDIGVGRREPFHEDGLTLVLHHRVNGFKLSGARWGDRQGEEIILNILYERILVAGEYTIVGVVSAYSDQWVKGDFALPEAFVSPTAADAIRRMVSQAEDDHPDIPRYLPRSISLLYAPDLTADALFDEALQKAGDRRQTSYQINDLGVFDSTGTSTISLGNFEGIDELTGKTRQVYFQVQGSLANISYDQAVYAAPLTLLTEGGLRLPGLLPIPLQPVTPDNAREMTSLPLQSNTYAYPLEDDAGGTLQRLLPGLMSLLTFIAVLQIFLTQLRRRAKRLALLKALGATQGQVAAMLLMEAGMLVLVALPVGTALGLLLSFGAVEVLKAFQGEDSVRLFWPVMPLIKALLLGALAVFIGVLLPLVQAVRIPLSGAFEAPAPAPRRFKSSGAQKKVAYNRMVWRNALSNPGRSLLGFVLAVLIILSPLATLFLGFHSFSNYRVEVLDKARPDYVLTMPYGMNIRVLNDHRDRLLAQVPGLASVQPWLFGDHVGIQISDQAFEAGPILQWYQQYGGAEFGLIGAEAASAITKTDFGFQQGGMVIHIDPELELCEEEMQAMASAETLTQEKMDALPTGGAMTLEELQARYPDFNVEPPQPKVEEVRQVSYPQVVYTALWALDPELALLPRLIKDLDAGQVDEEAFKKGEQVILVVPRYRVDQNDLVLSHHPRDKGSFMEDAAIQPGDRLTLHTEVVQLAGDSKSSMNNDTEVTVAGILYDYSLPGVWPLSDTSRSYLLIGSQRLLAHAYPQAESRMTAYQARYHRLAVKVFYPYSYGQTQFIVTLANDANPESADIAMQNFARENALDIKTYRTANQALRSLAVNSALLIAMLGCAVFLIALVILSSSLQSAVQQEKKRFGILQSMGVTRDTLLGGQSRYGLVIGLLAVLAANLLLAMLIVIVTALSLPNGVSLLPQLRFITLRGYPLLAHILICLGFILFSALMHAWPLRTIARQTAIANILDTNAS